MNKYIQFIIRKVKMYVFRDRFLLSVNRWFKDDGDNTLRLDYNLNSNSLVFDVGGYKGDFANAIYEKYRCNIFIFEPVEVYYNRLKQRFITNEKIKVFNFGLSNRDHELLISLNCDGSSVYGLSKDKEKIELRCVANFINENNIGSIDLMKINIEGGEFDVLPKLIETSLIDKIYNLQVQFHTFIPDAVNKRNNIRTCLSETHILSWDYYFVWENWTIKK